MLWKSESERSIWQTETVLKAQFKKADQKIAFEQKAISIWKVMQFFLFLNNDVSEKSGYVCALVKWGYF